MVVPPGPNATKPTPSVLPPGSRRTLTIFPVAVSQRSTLPLYMPTAKVAVPGLNAADSTAWLPAGAARVADGPTSVAAPVLAGALAAVAPGPEASTQETVTAAARTTPVSAITSGRRRAGQPGLSSPAPGSDRALWPAATACVTLGLRYRSAVTPGPRAGRAGSRSPGLGEVAPGKAAMPPEP